MGNTIGFMKAHASRVRALLRIEINGICGLVCLEVVHPDRKPTINKSATKWATTEAKTEWKTERRQQEMMMIVFGFVQWIGLVAGEFRNQKLENYERERGKHPVHSIGCFCFAIFIPRSKTTAANWICMHLFVCRLCRYLLIVYFCIVMLGEKSALTWAACFVRAHCGCFLNTRSLRATPIHCLHHQQYCDIIIQMIVAIVWPYKFHMIWFLSVPWQTIPYTRTLSKWWNAQRMVCHSQP